MFLTLGGKEVHSFKLSPNLKSKTLWPTISMGSRDDELLLNFGVSSFIFDLDQKLKVLFEKLIF